ncbi:MAG: potassium channel family protein [Burkholderiales bacterium]
MRLPFHYKHVVLLVVLIAGLAFQQHTAQLRPEWQLVHELFIVGLMIGVFFVVFEHAHSRWWALGIGAVAAICTLLRFVPGLSPLPLAVVYDLALAAFFGFAAVRILANIFRRPEISGDAVIGSVCGYLLAGVAWASLYSLVETLQPGSFAMSPELAKQLNNWYSSHALFHYFSFVTLTTMGYGDVTPLKHPATMLAWLEAVFGQFYIAVVVAQLVGARMARALRPDSEGPG